MLVRIGHHIEIVELFDLTDVQVGGNVVDSCKRVGRVVLRQNTMDGRLKYTQFVL